MAKKPTDLSSKAWNKLKELTVPKTGFGDKLDAYDKAKKVTEVLLTRNLASFNSAATALANITKHIPDAQKKCNKTLHKDTIAALEAYKPLIATESTTLNKAFIKYQGNIDRTLDRLKVVQAEMKVHKQTMTALAKSSVDNVKTAVAAKKTLEAIQLIKAGVAALKTAQEKTNESLVKWRAPVEREDAAHADDRPDNTQADLVIKMTIEIDAMRANAESDLAVVLEALTKAMPAVPKTPVRK